MDTLRACVVLAIGSAFTPLAFSALASVPDYKLGDVANEDVITPVPLVVVNLEATEALKEKLAQDVPFVVRYNAKAALEAETELRQNIAAVRSSFLAALQRALQGRPLVEAVAGSPIFARAVAEAAREAPKDFPLDALSRIWIRGASEEMLVETLVRPLREAVAVPVVQNGVEMTLPRNQTFRVLPVTNFNGVPASEELEKPEQTIASGKVLSVAQARRAFATLFPGGQEDQARFLASFIRPNAMPDPAIRESLRAKKTEDASVNDTFAAGQVVIAKGHTIDRQALAAIGIMREKNLVEMASAEPGPQRTAVGRVAQQIIFTGVSFAVIGVLLFVILRRLRVRSSTALVPDEPEASGWERVAVAPSEAGGEVWKYRAIDAERKVERAHAAIRSGVMDWMREKVFRTLVHHRGELLSAQQKAEQEIRELVDRLEQLHAPLQERIAAYEKRIAELERDLAAKDEENRELIGSRIYVTKQQLLLERERSDFGTN
ncbi:MAG: hypothetical protein ABIZ81_00730 [Opitutaceae bacterium]